MQIVKLHNEKKDGFGLKYETTSCNSQTPGLSNRVNKTAECSDILSQEFPLLESSYLLKIKQSARQEDDSK